MTNTDKEFEKKWRNVYVKKITRKNNDKAFLLALCIHNLMTNCGVSVFKFIYNIFLHPFSHTFYISNLIAQNDQLFFK